MKLLVILFSAFFVAALFDVELAVSQTARVSQAVRAADEQALDECQARYAGGREARFAGGRPRGDLRRDRWALIEACFKGKTGMYLFQTDVKCNPPYRHFRSLRCLQKNEPRLLAVSSRVEV